MPAKVGTEQKEGFVGNREQRWRQTQHRVHLGETTMCESETSNPSDQNRHIGTRALGMNKVHRHEGIAHRLPPASGVHPGLCKSKGKPRKCKESAKPRPGEKRSLGETAPALVKQQRPCYCPALGTSALSQNTKNIDDHKGSDFMQMQNALMRRRKNVKFC